MPRYTRKTLPNKKEAWITVEDFEIIPLDRDDPIREFKKTHAQEHVVCLSGTVLVEWDRGRVVLQKRDWVDIPADSTLTVRTSQQEYNTGNSEILWMAGHWPQTDYIAMFKFYPGRPCDYHFHDGEEYWFMFRGSSKIVYDGEELEVQQGDLVAMERGYEHGAPEPTMIFEGVGFTPKYEGAARRGVRGHLYRGPDGDPEAVRRPRQS